MRLYHVIGCAAAGGLLTLSGAMAATVPVSQSFESFAHGYSIVDHAHWSTGGVGRRGIWLIGICGV